MRKHFYINLYKRKKKRGKREEVTFLLIKKIKIRGERGSLLK